MLTHYAKLRPRQVKLANTSESLVYNFLPDDRLFTFPEVGNLYEISKEKPSLIGNKGKALLEIVNNLADRGFLKEINGTRLDKFVTSF